MVISTPSKFELPIKSKHNCMNIFTNFNLRIFNAYHPFSLLFSAFLRMVAVDNGMAMPPVNTAATSAAWPAARVQRQRLPTRFGVFEAKMYPLGIEFGL